MKEFNLLGKDYFTLREAAHYCSVSESQFNAHSRSLGIQSTTFMGKRVFRRKDLQRAIEEKFQWQVSLNARGGEPSETDKRITARLKDAGAN